MLANLSWNAFELIGSAGLAGQRPTPLSRRAGSGLQWFLAFLCADSVCDAQWGRRFRLPTAAASIELFLRVPRKRLPYYAFSATLI